MQAANNVEFGRPGFFRFDGLLSDLFNGHLIRAVLILLSMKGAEGTTQGTDV